MTGLEILRDFGTVSANISPRSASNIVAGLPEPKSFNAMTQDTEIAILQSIIRLFTHVCELQQQNVRLQDRVQKLEDPSELRDLLDSEPAPSGDAYSLPEVWEGPSPFASAQD